MDVSLGTANFMEDQTLGLQRVATNVTVKAWFNFEVYDWQAAFHMPGEVEIDFGVGARGHGRSPLKRAIFSNCRQRPSRKESVSKLTGQKEERLSQE